MKYTQQVLGAFFPEKKMKKRQALKYYKQQAIESNNDYDLEYNYDGNGYCYAKDYFVTSKFNRWRAAMWSMGYRYYWEVTDRWQHHEWMANTFGSAGEYKEFVLQPKNKEQVEPYYSGLSWLCDPSCW